LHQAKFTLFAVGQRSKRRMPLGEGGWPNSDQVIGSFVETPVALTVIVAPHAPEAIAAVVIFAVPEAIIAPIVPPAPELVIADPPPSVIPGPP